MTLTTHSSTTNERSTESVREAQMTIGEMLQSEEHHIGALPLEAEGVDNMTTNYSF